MLVISVGVDYAGFSGLFLEECSLVHGRLAGKEGLAKSQEISGGFLPYKPCVPSLKSESLVAFKIKNKFWRTPAYSGSSTLWNKAPRPSFTTIAQASLGSRPWLQDGSLPHDASDARKVADQ